MHVNGSNGISSDHSTQFPQNEQNNEQEIDLLKLLNILLLNKWKIIAFTVVFGAAAAGISLMMTPIYESSGTLFISESKNRYSYAGSDLSNLLTTTYGIGMGSTIANELQILRSIALSYDVAERLSEIEFDENGDKFPILMRSYPDDPTSTTIDTVAARFRETISFSQVDPEADLIQITFESPSPYEASTIVNLTMDTYSHLSTAQNRLMAVEALNFLRGERSRIEKELALVEDSLRNFMNKTKLVSVDPQTDRLINNLADIEAEKKTVEVNLVAIKAGIDQYRAQLDDLRPGLSDNYSESLGAIIQRYQYALSEIMTEKALMEIKNPSIDENHPEIVRLNQEIEGMKARIKALTSELLDNGSLESLGFAIQGGESSVIQRLAEISEKLIELEVEHLQYETQLKILDGYYSELEEQFNELPVILLNWPNYSAKLK